ncbi:MAG TPA: Crp/Fnr family transcriptional regulator [Flavobacteriia bacterium]|nr:Crp/Fnr family transcriptional regulator [Flavobacteriia bacterium]
MPNCNSCIIRELNSLNKLNTQELKDVSNHKQTLTFKKGETIFEEGTKLKGIFCLRNGKCKVTKLAPNGNEQIVRFIQKGEMIGHRSIISDTAAHLTVTALEDMEACFIPKSLINKNFSNNKEFTYDITKSICTDLDNANISIANLAQKSVKERLADSLLFFLKTFGLEEEGYLNIKLSREEIANSIGTATESSIRILSNFKKEGIIEVKGKRIKILDKEKLEHISLGY